jgi:hypothetical protein
VASHSYRLGRGTNVRLLPVPRRVKPGTYLLSIRVVTAGVTRMLGRTVRIPR